jgi:DNA-binding LacI/PurR family transcriptional regulator
MRLREFQKKRIPVVVVGRPSAPNIHYVDSDNVGIGRLMTRHLFEAGFRKPAFVGFSKEQTLTKDRLAGYKTEVRNHGLQVHRNLISIHDRSENVEKDYTESLLKNGADSLVCEDDLMALRTIKSIHVLGLSVSKDIGIVGCNNSSFVHYSNPPISSVEIFPDKIGACAAEKLLCIMEGAECDIQTIVPHKLYVRTSSQGETQ